jgi:cell wall-associated NlpC family hydrolase
VRTRLTTHRRRGHIATRWQEGAPLRTPSMGARAFIPVALAGAVLLTIGAGTAAAYEPSRNEGQQIIRIAKAQGGDPWRYGATGPNSFDCSGLVIYAYKQAGDYAAIKSGDLRTAGAMYRYFKNRGKVSSSNPRVGDLVAWGYGDKITHIGMYIGDGKAVSTLTSGVRIHGVHAVTANFKGYVHTGMWAKLTTAGWAARHEVSKDLQAADTAAERSVEEGDVVRSYGWFNLRSGPGTSAPLQAVLSGGTELTVVGFGTDSIDRTWLKVKTGDRTGYVAQWVTTD